jgi:uncharacterized protein YjbI with pentapeptide repeats
MPDVPSDSRPTRTELDERELDIRAKELALRQQELRTGRGKRERWTLLISALGVLIAAAATGVSAWQIKSSAEQFQENLTVNQEQFQRDLAAGQQQFENSLRINEYTDIVNGLSSPAVAVQVNSIRRLAQYVSDPENFRTAEDQQTAGINAVQTLAAFIEDESTKAKGAGLTNYRTPQPIVVSRAISQLTDLLKSESLKAAAVDVSRGNFHGVDLPDLELDGRFIADAADFRRGFVTGWDLTSADNVSLQGAFFTCANLRTSNLGPADVSSADFTGADLGGAILSDVRNLDEEQLRGATIGEQTQLPDGIDLRESPGWGRDSTRCRTLVDNMTSLPAGAEYDSYLPCNGEIEAGPASPLRDEEIEAVGRVCTLRDKLAEEP